MSASADAEGVNLGIIITPMLDMAFQILAFFVMTYHPSALEGHIDGTLLPPSKISIKGDKAKPAESKPDETPVDQDPKDEKVVVVLVKSVMKGQTVEGLKLKKNQVVRTTLTEGEPIGIKLKKPLAEDAEPIADTDSTFEQGLTKLAAALKEIQEQSVGSKTTINIEADRDLKHGYFIQVYDVCKGAKFANVGFIAPPPLAK